MKGRRGQAAVETAIVMPLSVFLVLGLLQLFMVLQARILTQYAASRAVRAGALNFGDCLTMRDAAHLVLLPAIDASFARSPAVGAKFAEQAQVRMSSNRYQPGQDGKLTGPVVWIDRLQPLVGDIGAEEEEVWDLPPHKDFEIRMVFWAPLKIPFANWVFARMALAHWGVQELHTVDPLLPTKRDAKWTQQSVGPRAALSAEMRSRYDAQQYVFPIQVTGITRMMSPARFRQQDCGL